MAHVFISYVRENERFAAQIAEGLRALGVEVWLDRERIEPGQRWRTAIQRAIRSGALFVACFSQAWATRGKAYMNEELTLAIEELRQRNTDRAWFIPVRLDDADVPDLPIGRGETLRDLHWIDLRQDWNDGMIQIVRAAAHAGAIPLRDDISPNDPVSAHVQVGARAAYFMQHLAIRALLPFSEVRPLLYDELEKLIMAPPRGRPVSLDNVVGKVDRNARAIAPVHETAFPWYEAFSTFEKLLCRTPILIAPSGHALPPTPEYSVNRVVALAPDWRLALDGEFILELSRAGLTLQIHDVPAITEVLRPPLTKENEAYIVAVLDYLLRSGSLLLSRYPPYTLRVTETAG